MEFSIYMQFTNGSKIAMVFNGESFDDAKAYGFELAKRLHQNDDRFEIKWFKVQPIGEHAEVVL